MQPYRLIGTERDFLIDQPINHLLHDKSSTASQANHSILSTEVLSTLSHNRFIIHMPEIAKAHQFNYGKKLSFDPVWIDLKRELES